MFDEGAGDDGDDRPGWAHTYILDSNHKPIPEYDTMAWAIWYGKFDKTIAGYYNGCLAVSTIFLGVDHNYGNGPPLLFESMGWQVDGRRLARMKRGYRPKPHPLFGRLAARSYREFFNFQYRYHTYEGALEGHAMISRVINRCADHELLFEILDKI